MNSRKIKELRDEYNKKCLGVLNGWKYTDFSVEEMIDILFPFNNLIGYDDTTLREFVESIESQMETFDDWRFAQCIYNQLVTDPTGDTDYFYEEPIITYKRIKNIKIKDL